MATTTTPRRLDPVLFGSLPHILHFTTNCPLGFNAEDANLYRYAANDPSNATDPSGQFIVFANKNEAEEFIKKLKEYGAKNVSMVTGKQGTYVIVDPSDRDAVFKYADEKFKELFVKRDFFLSKEGRELAERRNRFLRSAGVFGLDPDYWTDVEGEESATVDRQDWKEVIKAINKRLEAKESKRPLVIDIGGEILSGDRLNVNVGGIRSNQPIPRLVPRPDPAGHLPFQRGSVDKIFMENVPLTGETLKQTASEIARVIKAGGTIVLANAGNDADTKEIHQAVIDAVGARGTVKQEVINGSLTTTIHVHR